MKFAAVLSTILAFAAPAAARAADEHAAERAAVAEVVTGIGLHADLREWESIGRLLGDSVRVDYTSLFGGDVATQTRDALLAQWRGSLPGFDATQHLIGNVLVEVAGKRATARSHVRATHRIGSELWVVGGTYTHKLVRSGGFWRVTEMTFALSYEEGDRGLVSRAVARAAAANPG